VNDLFEKVCKVLGKTPSDFYADLHFVGVDEIRALNKKWRGKDEATDVLSFPLLDFNHAVGKMMLGDIVICRECMGENSVEFLYLHGLLHLFGYMHETDEDEARMNAIITEVLGK
jgi:probable rRNA maturation factor